MKDEGTMTVLAPEKFVEAMPVRVDVSVIELPEYENRPLISERRNFADDEGAVDMTAEYEQHKAEHGCDPCCDWKVPPRWDLFYGNNHNFIANHYGSNGGGVSFIKHIGQPLTDALWTDLLYRMHVERLRIYRPRESRWMDGLGDGACVISLDENDLVKDIYLVPHKRKAEDSRSVGWGSLVRALEVAVAKAEGIEPRIYTGAFEIAGRKGVANPEWDEVKEALEVVWERANRPFLFYECPPVAYINDYATAKIRVE